VAGNWNAAAALTGGRVNRFNVAKQSRDYDPNGGEGAGGGIVDVF